MRIDSSVIGMESARSYKASSTTIHRFVIMDYQENLAQTGTTLGGGAQGDVASGQLPGEEVNMAEGSVTNGKSQDWQDYFGISSSRISLRKEDSSIAENLRQVTLRYIFELLFAQRRDRLKEWMDEKGFAGETVQSSANTQTLSVGNMRMQSLTLVQETYYMEQESTSFSSTGTVKTKDGREIDFQVNVGMSRTFEQTFFGRLDLAAFQTIDPLVINLDTDVATVRDQTFFFDLDSDGQEEEISMLNGASGYLALDKNGDGKINNGNELFGTKTGDGFAELAQYDEDGDGWIDEDDDIWSKLQIWCKDENGQDKLYRLTDKGVGAICLSSADTEFSQKDVTGNLQATIRSTGVFLYENGNVGTVQHLDLAT